MRMSDWSSDVCSSDLNRRLRLRFGRDLGQQFHAARFYALRAENEGPVSLRKTAEQGPHMLGGRDDEQRVRPVKFAKVAGRADRPRKDRKSTRLNSSH